MKDKEKRHRRGIKVKILITVLCCSSVLAYFGLKLAGCIRKAYVYDMPYYEPRDIERGEAEKWDTMQELGKSVEQLELERTAKYLKYRDVARTEDAMEQERLKIIQRLQALREEERHKTIWEKGQAQEEERLYNRLKEIEAWKENEKSKREQEHRNP